MEGAGGKGRGLVKGKRFQGGGGSHGLKGLGVGTGAVRVSQAFRPKEGIENSIGMLHPL